MSVIRSREAGVAVAGLSLAVALSIAVAILAPESPRDVPPGSSLSKSADGSAAAYLTLQELGYTVARSFEPVASLAIDPAATVLIVADPAQDASAGDRRAVQSLVSAGATVIVTGCRAGSFFAEGSDGGAAATAARQFTARQPSPLTVNVPRVSMNGGCLRPDLAPRFIALYGDADADVVRVSRIGRGLAVWWAANTPMANASIAAPGHLELLLNAIGPPGRTILWDEFYHGQHRSLYSYAKQTPLPWVAGQVVLITAVAGLMFTRRRAPIVQRPVLSRVSALEFVDTMGNLYGRVNTAPDAIQTARIRLRRLLIDTTGMAVSATDERLASAAAARTGVGEAELTQVLAATAASDTSAGPDEALALVRRLQTCANAVERAGG